ncbi:MAG: 3-dehydroquinate synthase, partial [Bacteroidota bacterium]
MIRLEQNFQVSYHYPVIFTDKIFSISNTLLKDYLEEVNKDDFRKKILFVIEKSLTEANKDLINEIIAYFKQIERIELVEEILVLEGGE